MDAGTGLDARKTTKAREENDSKICKDRNQNHEGEREKKSYNPKSDLEKFGGWSVNETSTGAETQKNGATSPSRGRHGWRAGLLLLLSPWGTLAPFHKPSLFWRPWLVRLTALGDGMKCGGGNEGRWRNFPSPSSVFLRGRLFLLEVFLQIGFWCFPSPGREAKRAAAILESWLDVD